MLYLLTYLHLHPPVLLRTALTDARDFAYSHLGLSMRPAMLVQDGGTPCST